MKTDTPRPIRLEDYRPSAYLIDKVDLDFALAATRTRVKSRLRLRPNPAVPSAGGPLRLDGEHFEVEDMRLDGKELTGNAFRPVEGGVEIANPPKRPFEMEVTTYVNPESNKALQGLYRSRGVYCTQCEAQGFRRITYFLDRPDVLSTYTVRIEADREEAPVLLANGNPVERGVLERGRRHFAVWRDPHPKPCYLFALVGGNLSPIASTFTTASGRMVDLGIFVEHGKETRAAWAMDALKRAMAWDEKRFGREYDLDVFNIVAVSDFNMGAMENKGLNIFNDRLILASPETATDASFEAIESVVAHEYFHNWTGNRITCRDWFQLCLKEGLTVYRDQEFSADERSATVQRIVDVRALKAQQFPEDAGPLAHPVRPRSYIEINNFYTATVYEKGAEVVRMIETLLGRERFRAGMDLYFARHDGEAATIEDFIKCFEDAGGADLAQFKLWYEQAGTPELVCAFRYDKAAKTAELTIEQVLRPTPGEPKKSPLHIPLRLGLVSPNGHDMPLVLADDVPVADGIVQLKERRQTLSFKGLGSRPVPSLLRGFSAPVNLTLELSDRDLEFLMAHDSDLFNRWQAANRFATLTILQIVEAMHDGRRSTRGSTYAKALGATVADETLEPAYRAELLKLPSQSDIVREMGKDVDPGLICRAHRQLARLCGRVLGDVLEAIYDGTATRGRYSPDAASAGRRSLRNTALTLLVARKEKSDIRRLVEHYAKADNMTDAAHALHLLASHAGPERTKALDHFYARWQHDHLVIDTWFAAHAQSQLSGALEDVRRLTQHPLFNRRTPNKVRALIGTFVLSNPVQFNRPDGAGYNLLADEALAIDKFNPQIAARLLGAFRGWRSLEKGRRVHAEKALKRIGRGKGLSRDVFEIVAKMLEK